MALKPSTYAIYKGDTFLAIGTKKECARLLGTTLASLESRLTRGRQEKTSYENSLIAVKLDGEE